MAEEMTGAACGLYETLPPLPRTPVPGMAYVPYQQWTGTCCPPTGLWTLGRCSRRWINRFWGEGGSPDDGGTAAAQTGVRRQVRLLGAAPVFGHPPQPQGAAKRLEEYEARAAKLTKEYEEQFGPMGELSQNTSRWAWVSDPWPWEKEGN